MPEIIAATWCQHQNNTTGLIQLRVQSYPGNITANITHNIKMPGPPLTWLGDRWDALPATCNGPTHEKFTQSCHNEMGAKEFDQKKRGFQDAIVHHSVNRENASGKQMILWLDVEQSWRYISVHSCLHLWKPGEACCAYVTLLNL